MTKIKKQLRAEAVERLKNCVAARFDAESIVIALTSGRHGQSDWSLECDKLIYLLTDDTNDDSTPEKVVSGSEPCVTPESCRQYADQRKQGDDADCESYDSREKLEADMRERIGELWADAWDAGSHDSMGDDFDINVFTSLLDRQAAITAEEAADAWEEYRDATQREIAKLTAERDELKERADYNIHGWAKANIGWAEANAEVEKWQMKCDEYRSKFGKCLDYADAIHALMDDEWLA